MQFLRCFSASLAGIELPLPESSADALIGVLLAPTAQQRAARLAAAMRESPTLVVWVVDRCGVKGFSFNLDPTLGGLAAGFAEDLPLALNDSLLQYAEGQKSDRGQLPSKALQAITIAVPAAVDALEVARRAVAWIESGNGGQREDCIGESSERAAVEGVAVGNVSLVAEMAYLLGLLHNIDAYRASPKARGRSEKVLAATLVANLEPYLGVLDSRSIPLAAEAVVRGWADWIQSQAVAEDRCAALQQAWMGEGPAAGRLPALTQSLCRLARLESEFEVALEEAKLQAMYKLAAGAGHEINNPLGSIAGRAQLLLRDENEPERRRTLAKINSQAFRAHEMIADMMLFARPPVPQFEQIAPATLIQSLVDEMHEITEQQEAEIVSHIATDVATLRVDASQLRVALRAMCTNALEATGLGGRIEITVSHGPVDKVLHERSAPVETVQITVRDNGPGFSEEERQHLFDPFYSGREAGRGLGFGLSKCWRIVRNHGGRIDVQSDPGRGATFEITLPVA